MFLTSLKQICNEYLIKFSENQSAPKLENRKTSPCSSCAPNLLHVLVSRIVGHHNLCSPDLDGEIKDAQCRSPSLNEKDHLARYRFLINHISIESTESKLEVTKKLSSPKPQLPSWPCVESLQKLSTASQSLQEPPLLLSCEPETYLFGI